MNLDIEGKKKLLEEYTLVLYKDETIYTSNHRGVRPLVEFLEKNIDFAGFSVLDRVIGKASASLLCKAKVKEAYTNIISIPALEVLEKHGIEVTYKLKVDNILNNEKTDICPMEKLCLDIDDENVAYEAILKKLNFIK